MLNQYPLFDCHFHIIDKRFPLVTNQGFLPDEFTLASYRERMQAYDLRGGAIVSGSFQGFDQSYLLSALQQAGPGFVGVSQLPNSATTQDIQHLHKHGVRAVRFNLRRGGSEDIRHLLSLARRVFEIAAWHVELYVDSAVLVNLEKTLAKLPAVCIDHLGLGRSGFKFLLRLAERDVKIKASGFGRVEFPIAQALKSLYSANPNSLMFGTDLPSTRAARPYIDSDFSEVANVLGAEAAERVFYSNAVNFYRV